MELVVVACCTGGMASGVELVVLVVDTFTVTGACPLTNTVCVSVINSSTVIFCVACVTRVTVLVTVKPQLVTVDMIVVMTMAGFGPRAFK